MADVLVVTSKVKKLIKEKGQMNTSAETIDVLSKAIEQLCLKGVESAKADGRKTVMARDIVIDHLQSVFKIDLIFKPTEKSVGFLLLDSLESFICALVRFYFSL